MTTDDASRPTSIHQHLIGQIEDKIIAFIYLHTLHRYHCINCVSDNEHEDIKQSMAVIKSYIALCPKHTFVTTR